MASDGKTIRLVVLTANSHRHKFFANFLASRFNLVGVVSEEKRPIPLGKNTIEDEIITEHKKGISASEQKFFGQEVSFNLPQDKILNLAYGDASSPEAFKWVSNLKPDYIALYGTSIIRPPLNPSSSRFAPQSAALTIERPLAMLTNSPKSLGRIWPNSTAPIV